MQYVFMILLFVLAVLLILVILVQRGKGGGLAGALGGMGGQSAFGTKAGDLFTRITIGVAVVWIVLCVVAVKAMNTGGRLDERAGGPAQRTSAPSPASEQGGEKADPGAPVEK